MQALFIFIVLFVKNGHLRRKRMSIVVDAKICLWFHTVAVNTSTICLMLVNDLKVLITNTNITFNALELKAVGWE